MRDNHMRIIAAVGRLDPFPCISAVSQAELEGGVYVDSQWEVRRRSGLENILATFAIIDFTSATAAAYGRIVEKSGFSRRKIVDRMIAATALENDLTLITTNGADFADIDGLKLEIWNP